MKWIKSRKTYRLSGLLVIMTSWLFVRISFIVPSLDTMAQSFSLYSDYSNSIIDLHMDSNSNTAMEESIVIQKEDDDEDYHRHVIKNMTTLQQQQQQQQQHNQSKIEPVVKDENGITTNITGYNITFTKNKSNTTSSSNESTMQAIITEQNKTLESTTTIYTTSTNNQIINNTSISTIPNQNGTTNHHHRNQKGLDFIIAAFPKCATSTLQREVLQHHDEITMLRKTSKLADGTEKYEEYVLQNKQKVIELFEHISETNTSTTLSYSNSNSSSSSSGNHASLSDMKLGIKWPRAIVGRFIQFLKYMKELNPLGKDPKIIIGMRHPIRWFESRYNFEHITGKSTPSLSLLKKADTNDEVFLSYLELGQFEKHIMQLGLVPVDDLDSTELERMGDNFVPTTNGVFFYLQEQFENETLARDLFKDMRVFLDLEKPIRHELLQNHTYAKKSIFDICEADYSALRKVLVMNANVTVTWIRDKLMKGKHVQIGGKEGFLRLLDAWIEDPCAS